MAHPPERNPDSAPGDWYIDTRCINCSASRTVAPGLIVQRQGKSVFARQPANQEELAAWRALLVCPTASVRTHTYHPRPQGLFPHELAPGIYRCGYNARSSWGAHAYFIVREKTNVLVDAPCFTSVLVKYFEGQGGIQDVLLTHCDDVADADRYAPHFSARVWIHEDDHHAAPYATHILKGLQPTSINEHLLAIPVPRHTQGSVVFLLEQQYLFTGDSLAWNFERQDLYAFREACWYSWEAQAESLQQLTIYPFEWVFAGHGGSGHLPVEEMNHRLHHLVERMHSRSGR